VRKTLRHWPARGAADRVAAESDSEVVVRTDVVVLGAGIVGVSIAVHLQKRGRAVTLVDRRAPGEETSFGNAGLIQREGVYPYGFPHDFGALIRHALNRGTEAHYHLSALPKLAPFLARYWWASRPARHEQIMRSPTRPARAPSCARPAGSSSIARRPSWTRRCARRRR
jgi:glycine/D-amino acid oxidase-like deaminating enzyme